MHLFYYALALSTGSRDGLSEYTLSNTPISFTVSLRHSQMGSA